MDSETAMTAQRPLGWHAPFTGMALLLLVLCFGCASKGGGDAGAAAKPDAGTPPPIAETITESALYNKAQLRMRSGNFLGAIDLFKDLLTNFALGRYAEQAQIELIYAHFMSYQVEEARSEAERFLRLYPQHQNADYARFISAYTTFHRDDSVSSKTFRLNYARRDISKVRRSFEELAEFLNLHGDSPYASLARRRMVQLKEMMAFHELWVANFYLKRGAFLAVVQRANWMLQHIQGTSATPWALAMLARGYQLMDVPDEAAKIMQILRQSFAGHHSLTADGELRLPLRLPNDERGMASILTLGFFDVPGPGGRGGSQWVPPPLTERPESTGDAAASFQGLGESEAGFDSDAESGGQYDEVDLELNPEGEILDVQEAAEELPDGAESDGEQP